LAKSPAWRLLLVTIFLFVIHSTIRDFHQKIYYISSNYDEPNQRQKTLPQTHISYILIEKNTQKKRGEQIYSPLLTIKN